MQEAPGRAGAGQPLGCTGHKDLVFLRPEPGPGHWHCQIAAAVTLLLQDDFLPVPAPLSVTHCVRESRSKTASAACFAAGRSLLPGAGLGCLSVVLRDSSLVLLLRVLSPLSSLRSSRLSSA